MDLDDLSRLYDVADDHEAAVLDALRLKAGMIWECRGPHEDGQPDGWTVQAGEACDICGRTATTTTADEVRAVLAARPVGERCDPACPGWGVFDGNDETQIERCDECCRGLLLDGRELTDDDVSLLPEAQAALALSLAGVDVL